MINKNYSLFLFFVSMIFLNFENKQCDFQKQTSREKDIFLKISPWIGNKQTISNNFF